MNWQTNSHPVDRQFLTGNSEKYNSLAEHQFTPKLYQHQYYFLLKKLAALEIVFHSIGLNFSFIEQRMKKMNTTNDSAEEKSLELVKR